MKSRSLLILSAIVLLFASCGKKGGKSGLLVPKDAAVVVHINSSSLSSKLSWNEIKQTNWYKAIQTELQSTDTMAQRLLDDPSRSGVDTKKDFVMFIKKQGRGSYMVVEGSLTSQAAYELVLAEMTKKKPKEIKKAGEFSYMVPDEKSVLIWNNSKFAMVSNAHMPGNIAGGFMKNRRSPENFEFQSDSLRLFGEQTLTLEAGDNLDTDSRFADLVKNGSDVHVWMNIGQFTSGMNTMIPMAKTDAVFKDNITALSINFDNGKITARSKHYVSEEMNKIMADNKPSVVSADVINRIPSSNVVAVMAFNYSPKALKETLRVMGMDAMADIYLSKLDFSVDDFVKANKGEILVVVSDPKVKMDTMKSGGQIHLFPSRPDVNILFATSVNDKPAFEKMVTLAWDLSKQLRGGGMDGGTDKPGIPGISYKLENNWFAVSNSADYTDKFLAGGSNKQPFVDKITGHPLGLYIDLQRIIQFAGSMSKDSPPNKAIYDASLTMWQDITVKGGDYKDKSSEAEFEINLVDKNTNSLKQLNQYIDKMATIMQTMKKDRAEKWKNVMMDNMKDSSAVAVPKNSKRK